jgi:hypothetical protein
MGGGKVSSRVTCDQGRQDLVVNQSAATATEAHELVGEAGEAIKASREMIKAALRGMGAASDISEVSSQFRIYKMFDNGAIREFYSLLRAAMMGARKVGLLHRLVNDQMMPSILAKTAQ